MKAKAALVIQGGGTRAAFGSGVLDVLMEEGIAFPYLVGTSAGALSGLDVLSGDIGRNRYISCELVRDRKFLSFSNLLFRKSLFNFDYLFREVPKSKSPFNFEAYEKSDVEFWVATTSMETGKPTYFKKGECSDFWHALAASASQPLVSKPVMVEGHPYLDGGPTCNIPFRKALADGWKKIVVIASRDKDFRKAPANQKHVRMANRLYRKYPNFLAIYPHSGENYNQEITDLLELEKQGIAYTIRPETPITIGTAERDSEKLNALYEEGRRVAKKILPELKEFLSRE